MTLGDADREALFARLSAHAAAEHIDLAELERRIAAVDGARTRDEALAVLADLPSLPRGGGGGAGAGASGSDGAGAGSGAEPGRPRWGRGHGDADGPRDDWRPTAERFRDPKTRRVMRVWEDAAGGRHYVADD